MMDAAQEAIAYITKIRNDAKALTEALDLPQEATYTVMAVLHKARTPFATTLQPAASNSDAVLKDRIFQLSEGYITTQMKAQLPAFQTLWERIKTLPVEALNMGIQKEAPSAGLGFAGSQSPIPVISFISWAVINQSTLTASTPETTKEAMVKEAQSRGFSRSQSYALAHYLQQHLLQG